MAKLWVFGDSFCAHNKNWINTIYNKGKFSEIEILGVSGSSLFYTLCELQLNTIRVKPEDSVIIGFTGKNRHYFQNVHFSGGYAHRFDKNTKDYSYKVEKNILQAYKTFTTYLMDPEQERHVTDIFKYYIDNSILPKLNCNNIVLFNTINRDDYDGFEYDGMFETITSFFHEFLGRTHMESEDIVRESMTQNHWVDHPDYEEYFWNKYSKLFEHLWQ